MTSATDKHRANVVEIVRNVPAGLELGLRNYWYPVLHSEQLPPDRPIGFKVLNEALVAWRDRDGRPNVVRDKCPHRSVKLSAGRVLDGQLQCSWHGLRFDGTGRCRLVPWEPENSSLLANISTPAYPAAELGGWIWTYVGDTTKFPPPALSDVVPEELLHPERFIVFRLLPEVWTVNWLQALDGSDGYHAVMLHSDSQTMAKDAATVEPPKRPSIPLADRRMKVVNTPQGLRGLATDMAGGQIHHGHFMDGWRGDRWTLPALYTIPISPAPHLPPYVARHYQFAVDATHAQGSRWIAMRATTDEERARCTHLWENVVGPRVFQVLAEDRQILETLGDLVESRSGEYLFRADMDVVSVRRMMANAWSAQLEGSRPIPSREALVFPV